MARNDDAPATKADLKRLVTREHFDATIRRLEIAIRELTNRVNAMREVMVTKAELRSYAMAVERVVRDSQANWRRHLVHDDRIAILERHSEAHHERIASLEKRGGT